jgi:glycosyltransferase involved in cell wall biosynthesis
MKVSVVIPAYNEEDYLPKTLDALKEALRSITDTEIIVVDNQSTDPTRAIALQCGARIVEETEHNIGRVRNAGAEAANGNVIVFIDADTIVRPGVIEKIVEAMSDETCVGGSVKVEYERASRAWVRFFMRSWLFWARFTRMRQGALQFCRSDVFQELGGYDDTIYVGEDIEFHWRLDKYAQERGGFTAFIEEPRVLTSSRRWDKMGVRMLFIGHPVTIFLGWRTRFLWKDWYENAIR